METVITVLFGAAFVLATAVILCVAVALCFFFRNFFRDDWKK